MEKFDVHIPTFRVPSRVKKALSRKADKEYRHPRDMYRIILIEAADEFEREESEVDDSHEFQKKRG